MGTWKKADEGLEGNRREKRIKNKKEKRKRKRRRTMLGWCACFKGQKSENAVERCWGRGKRSETRKQRAWNWTTNCDYGKRIGSRNKNMRIRVKRMPFPAMIECRWIGRWVWGLLLEREEWNWWERLCSRFQRWFVMCNVMQGQGQGGGWSSRHKRIDNCATEKHGWAWNDELASDDFKKRGYKSHEAKSAKASQIETYGMHIYAA